MTIHFHKNDLPADVTFGDSVAIDTETLGLINRRDPLCLVQLSSGDGDAHIVQMNRATYDAPNLKALLEDKKITKIFHFARFDIAVMKIYLGVDCTPNYCTRTASKLARTYTDRHGLRECCRELLGVDLNKQQQSSDWGADDLSEAQLSYAASDVYHLHALRAKLDTMLIREDRMKMAEECMKFLPTRAELDIRGWDNMSIFNH